MPPPTHMVTMPSLLPVRLSWRSSCPVMREPVAPYGWPIEIDPPHGDRDHVGARRFHRGARLLEVLIFAGADDQARREPPPGNHQGIAVGGIQGRSRLGSATDEMHDLDAVRALEMIHTHRLSVIMGDAGTGKSYFIKLIDGYFELIPDIRDFQIRYIRHNTKLTLN